MVRRISLLALMLALAAPIRTHAEERSPEALYEEAIKAYNLGRFEQAIALFSEAYERDPAPVLLFNIAQAHKKLGHHERAIFFYRRYLETETQPIDRADVQARIRVEEEALAAEEAEARAKAAAALPPPPSTPAPAETAAAQPPVVAVTARPLSPESRGSPRMRSAGLWSAGVAALAVGAGVGFSLWTRSLAQSNSEKDVFDPDRDRLGRRVETLQWVAYGIGAAAAATSVSLLLLSRTETSPGLAFAPGSDMWSVTMQGRF